MLPLHERSTARISSRNGSAFPSRNAWAVSFGTLRGTSSGPASHTSRTAPREAPSRRAIVRLPCPSDRSRRIADRVLWSSITHLLETASHEELHLGVRFEARTP